MLALLSELPFESFEEEDESLTGYIKEINFDDDIRRDFSEIVARFGVQHSVSEIENQNWNAVWEASFQPIKVGNFCMFRADFHPAVSGFDHDLIINPKMAFGTGHHATTFMMMEQMEPIDFNQKTVLDYGCGTGILAILASRLGAYAVDAVDIESESFQNTIENCTINGVDNVAAWCGTLEVVPMRMYDIILANINRNVLMDTVDEMSDRLKPGGTLLISGILEADEDAILQSFGQSGLNPGKITSKDGWLCILFKTL